MKLFKIVIPMLSILAFVGCGGGSSKKQKNKKRPNILILMTDNHSWNHLGSYGDKNIKTPNIDALAANGVQFDNAYCASPSCSPARASMLTGQDTWRLGEGANLWASFPKEKVYTQLMKDAGYHVGIEGKGWGPGKAEVNGWEQNPGGERFDSFEEFYNEIEKGKPWMYWYSSRDPHRPFRKNGWKKAGIDLSKIEVPAYLPDSEEVRKDIADYYNEIQSFDKEVSSYLALIGEMGQLENTIVVICSDNGWQMPRGLANLYDAGSKIPLIISWPGNYKGGRRINDFVSLNDFAPTFLELAGVPVPKEMTAKSLLPLLKSEKEGRIDEERDFFVMARERHAYVRQNGLGYPGRAIRTDDYLYIKNYESDRWPAGDPPLFGDVDAHMLQYPCPSKLYILEHENDKNIKPYFDLSFSKRPTEELYDLAKDSDQINNVANDPAYTAIKEKIAKRMTDYLVKTGDPRETDVDFNWDKVPYYMEGDKYPRPGEKAIEALDLEEEYDYTSN